MNFKQSESDKKLLTTWNDVILSVNKLSTQLRGVAGCRDSVITICIRNGARMDTYSIPEDLPLPGMPTFTAVRKILLSNSTVKEGQKKFHLSYQSEKTEFHNSATTPRVSGDKSLDKYLTISKDIDGTEAILNGICNMNTKQIRSFLTRVRQRLNLNSFKWPDEAKSRFSDMTSEPIPTRPGRANSGLKSLILILQLSIECDPSWSTAVREEMKCYSGQQHNEGSLPAESDSFFASQFPKPQERCHFTESIHSSDDTVDDQLDTDSAITKDALGMWNTVPQECKAIPEDVQTINDNMSEVLDCSEDSLDELSEADEELARVLVRVEGLPEDTLTVSIIKSKWVSVQKLMANVIHPNVAYCCDWFVQKTPGDGNCLFSSILTAAMNRSNLPSNVESVSDLRGLLGYHLQQLSKAGDPTSPYKREWLAGILYDVDQELGKITTSFRQE